MTAVDYSGRPPGGAALAAAGVTLVMRYLSNDRAKNATPVEIADLHAHGVAVGLVWETTASRALGGAAAGTVDGKAARLQAAALGYPAGCTVFAAVDFDAGTQTLPGVQAYLEAFAAAVSPYVGGAYGSYAVCHAWLSAGRSKAWQTRAWSYGQKLAAACLYQSAEQTTIGGTVCDIDEIWGDPGAWAPPNIGDDMTPQQAQQLADTLATAGNAADIASQCRNWILDPSGGILHQLAELRTELGQIAATVGQVLEQVKPATHGTRDVAE